MSSAGIGLHGGVDPGRIQPVTEAEGEGDEVLGPVLGPAHGGGRDTAPKMYLRMRGNLGLLHLDFHFAQLRQLLPEGQVEGQRPRPSPEKTALPPAAMPPWRAPPLAVVNRYTYSSARARRPFSHSWRMRSTREYFWAARLLARGITRPRRANSGSTAAMGQRVKR